MNTLVTLILVISSQGYWLGGTTATVTIQWPIDAPPPPPAELRWELRLGPTRVADGKADVPDARKTASVALAVPEVRTATQLHFIYRLIARHDGTPLAGGDIAVHIWPKSVLGDFTQRYAGRKVVLIDPQNSLQPTLSAAGIKAERVVDAANIALLKPDVLIIAPQALPASSYAQPDLAALARSGVQVAVFAQTAPRALAGFTAESGDAAGDLTWRIDHPLLHNLDAEALNHWVQQNRPYVQLPAGTAALEIGWQKPAVESDLPSPMRALLLTQTLGTGRIVLCQLPANDPSADGRSRQLLDNVLNFLLAPPEPTPAPQQRRTTVPATAPRERTIRLSPGDQP